MIEPLAPVRRCPYSPFLIGAYVGELATVVSFGALSAAATLLPLLALGGYALLPVLALSAAGGLAVCSLTIDLLLKPRGLPALTWPQRWGGLLRGVLLVLLVLPSLVFVAFVVGVPLADAQSLGRAEEYVDGDTRRGAVLGLTAVLSFLAAPPVFAVGPWRRYRTAPGAVALNPPPVSWRSR